MVVIGGGQAGLSASWHLTDRGIDHVVLERDRIGSDWVTRRWDTFCLVTPNFQCRLPGYPYGPGGFGGTDPDGFMLRPQIVSYLRSYARSFDAPVYEGVTVTALGRDRAGYVVATSDGTVRAAAVVVATGGYHIPVLPELASVLGDDVVQLHSSAYRNPGMLPPGATLVVGTGQSGAQITEDLHRAGHAVHLAIGSAPRVARRYRGRDCMTWLEQMGVYDEPVGTGPGVAQSRDKTNHYVTGRDGGHDIDLRQFAVEGLHLHGRLLDLTAIGDGHVRARFGGNLADDLDHADAVSESIKDMIDAWIEAEGIVAPTQVRYTPVWVPPAGDAVEREVDLTAEGITSVIWAVGYRKDYTWIDVPVFDPTGYPDHERGVSGVPGLYFLGLPWLHTWGSGRFAAVGRDAAHVVEHLADALAGSTSVPA